MTLDATDPDERLLAGRYRLSNRIGGGAVADVYRATDERLGRPVAVKLFRGGVADELGSHEDEMRLLARLDHPTLVAIYDAGSDDEVAHGQPFIVMQLVDGGTLRELLLQEGRLNPSIVARYGADLAAALSYVHSQGLVHRDVKPANVLVARDGRVHLTDFGIARLVDGSRGTATGDVLGTPAYFSPEQVSGKRVSPMTDVYSLGLVLLECLKGEREYDGQVTEAAIARLHRAPVLPEWLPPGWQRLLTRMTALDPADRPTAADAERQLRTLATADASETTQVVPTVPASEATRAVPPADRTSIFDAPPIAAAEEEPVSHRRRRRSISALAVAVALLLVAAVVLVVILLAHRSNTYTPGTPRVNKPSVEQHVEDLEKAVRR